MIDFIASLFTRAEPVISEARPGDAAALAALHAACFNRGWNEDEFERLLLDRAVLAHRATMGRRIVGFIVSRIIAGEAEILSVAVATARRGRGLAKQMLNLHLRRLVGLGTRTVFLEVDEHNMAANRLYQRFGFRTVGRREGYYPDPLDHSRGNAFAGRGAAALVLRCDLP
jgi:ribosomal-protein-alanine N-acetyltransferase